jgi:hypothetical protein
MSQPLGCNRSNSPQEIHEKDILTELGTKGYWRVMENDVRNDPSATISMDI